MAASSRQPDDDPEADTTTFRLDHEARRALAALPADGTDVTAAVRSALMEAARRVVQLQTRGEAVALAADEKDVVEAAQVLLAW